MDFRGRAYPVPPHFNHLGNDLCRGLLLFHDGKPLGVRGLRWLKIHLANLYGLDKMKLDEREKFADNNLENIFDSTDRPLEVFPSRQPL
jgi:DNA-directed RNA polymerase, mitochondrial